MDSQRIIYCTKEKCIDRSVEITTNDDHSRDGYQDKRSDGRRRKSKNWIEYM